MAKLFADFKKRWSDKIRLPFFDSQNPRRAATVAANVTYSRALFVTVRRFKTVGANRSKKHKQLVIPTDFWPGKTREIAIRFGRRKISGFGLQKTAAMLLVAMGLTGAIFFGSQLAHTETPPPITASLPTPAEVERTEKADLPASRPTSLNIPSVGIKSDLLTVGRQSDGTMETPPLYSHRAGWYELGPTPGETGPAIIVGHVGTKNGPSVFWRLGELTPGAEVEISREDGQTVKFRVTGMEQFDRDAFPTEKVYGNIKGAGLRLITCGGTFDESTGRYTHNTVVFAEVTNL